MYVVYILVPFLSTYYEWLFTAVHKEQTVYIYKRKT